MNSFFRVSRILIGLFLCLLTVPGAPAQENDLVIEVVAEPFRPNILVLKTGASQPFSGQEKILKEINDLFLFDLTFSDAFNVFPETPQAAYINRKDLENGSVSFDDWRRFRIEDKMIDFLLKTVLIPRGDGRFELDVLVYDIVNGNRAIGRAYGGAPHPPFAYKNMRLAGHKASAEIIRTLTDGKVEPITETRFAFVNYNTTKQTKEIFLIDYDGWKDSLRQVTSFNSITQFPDWSPDGEELAYVSYKKNWPDCYIQNLPKGTVQTLAQFKGANNTPRWCPDGENLVISLSAPGNPEIYLLPRTGKNPKRLTTNSWKDLSPDVSPDGEQIAYVADRIGSPQIYVMSMEGTDIRRISYVNRKCESPFWSPAPIDGDFFIAFSGYFDSQQS
ncbi:MAG: hypothetical protein ACP5I1_08540, partial [Candidatus Hinthialibacter sp.]